MTKVIRKLLNYGEDQVRRQIVPATSGHGAHVYSKVRVADVIEIDALRCDDLRKYALMAHFDFVVADEAHLPHFALEFDGPGHETRHDFKKDQICRQADLALFRVNLPASENKLGEMSFLKYLVNVWFLGLVFEEMRINGEVSPGEPFVMSGFLKPDAKNIFDSEFDLLGPAAAKIGAYCKRAKIGHGALSHLSIGWLLMGSKGGEFVAFSIFPVDGTKLYGRAALGIKIPNFGLLSDIQFSKQELGQYCTALAIRELFDQLKFFHAGSGHVLRRRDEVSAEIEVLLGQNFSMLMAMSTGDEDELTRFACRSASAKMA